MEGIDISFPLYSGTVLSMVHVISGPDHLAAVTPLVVETKSKSWKIGIAWGIGHLSGMLSIGVLFMLFKEIIPVNSLSLYSEQLVGGILVGVGMWSFYRIFNERKKNTYPHFHDDDKKYLHVHEHRQGKKHTHKESNPRQTMLTALFIGVIHGFAGVAHFLLLLPILSLDNPMQTGQYIGGFLLGTVLAMTTYTIILGKIRNITKGSNNKMLFSVIRWVSGLFSVLIGVYWIFSNG